MGTIRVILCACRVTFVSQWQPNFNMGSLASLGVTILWRAGRRKDLGIVSPLRGLAFSCVEYQR